MTHITELLHMRRALASRGHYAAIASNTLGPVTKQYGFIDLAALNKRKTP